MIWAFPVGLIFALAAMVLISLPASRRYLETMGGGARHRRPARSAPGAAPSAINRAVFGRSR